MGSFLRWDEGPASEAGVSLGGAEEHGGLAEARKSVVTLSLKQSE